MREILKNEMIKKALDNFKPKSVNEKIPLKVQIGSQVIESIREELEEICQKQTKKQGK